MWKKVVIAIVLLCLTATAGLTAAGITRTNNRRQSFSTDGYVLQSDAGELKQISFAADADYQVLRTGFVTFTDAAGDKASVSRESFVHLSDNSVMALCDGILLDLNDLSDNFINNYYISAGLPITEVDGTYRAQTSAGVVDFGENIWKLSDGKYMIRASKCSVCLSEDEVYETEEYVLVSTEEDGIVRLITQDGVWSTISDGSYVETAGGVRIYPVPQLIDNGAYKLSVAKLSVNPDDAIVLTEAETRRQIVPELNIETIDGEDGADGEAGDAGENGTAGEAGTDGETGADGEAGQIGRDGAAGQTGEAGAAGMAGTTGPRGRGGADGDGGNPGVSAAASSNKTALPTMTITGWYPSSTQLSGTIAVAADGAELLNLSSSQYQDTVTIYNMDTGAGIPCYPVDAQTGQIVTDALNAPDPNFYHTFAATTGSVPFSTNGNALTPDTNYRFSVVAHYKVDNEIYSREFISREFYTDPTGISLSAAPASTSSVSVTADVAAAYQGGALQTATVELLTANGTTVGSYTLNYTSNQITNAEGQLGDSQNHTASVNGALSYNQLLTFNNLPSNTAYTAKVRVTTSSSTDTFDGYTKQVLPLTTLKQTPTVNKDAGNNPLKPTAFYNRASGVFEVTAPAITDTDGALVKYIYTAYTKNGDTYTKYGSSKENSSGTATFSLPSGTEYYFGVETEAYDNEKQLYLDLGKTATSVIAYGSSLPRLSLTGTPTFNGYTSGLLTITLESGSSLTVNSQHKLTVQLYADQVLDSTFQLSGSGNGSAPETDGTADSWYSAYYTPSETAPQIHFTLSKLLKNTTYQMILSGYLDLNDGNGPQFRTLGSVSFRTTNTYGLTASWANNLQTSATTSNKTFDQTVTLSFPNTVTQDEKDYILPFLKAGQVSVTLYSGSGNTRRTMETITFQGNDVEDLLASNAGLKIDDSKFTASVSPNSSYTLEITEVRDNSMTMYGATGGYNTFDVSGATQQIVTLPKTPDLLTDPTKGITATPIYNKDAAKYKSYGASYNSALDDDAIIGYTLASNYDNSAYNGDSIIYYAFELSKFYTNAQSGLDLRNIKTDTWENYTVMEPMEREFTRGSSATPGVTVLFGAKPDSFTQGTNGVYYAGEANYNSDTLTGMGRGYCYVFAYLVKYRLSANDTSGNTYEYPYSSEQYESYKAARGAGELLASGSYVGLNQCYILNSGVMKAPKQEPDIRTYVYGETKNGESGVVTVHYHLFSDPDSVIGSGTNIVYNNENNLFIPSDGDTRWVQGADTTGTAYDDWYSVSFSYTGNNTGNSATGMTLEPTLNTYLYNVSAYASSPYYIDVNTGGDTAYTHYFCHIPVERDWASYIAEHVSIECNTEHLNENYIDFILHDNTASGAYGGYAAELYSRAYSMSVTLTPETGAAVTRSLSLTSGIMNGTTYYYGRFMTGSLDQSYLNQTFTLTASILYDDGRQGLQFMDETSNRFALQYTNSTSAYDTFALGNWRTSSYSSSRPWNMLMSQNNEKLTTQALRNKVTEEHSMTSAENFQISRVNWTSSTSSLYLHPERWGVAMSSGSSASMGYLGALGEPGKQLFLTGKGYSPISFDNADRWHGNNGNSFKLTSITPTVRRSSTWYETTTETINVLDFNVVNYQLAQSDGGGKYIVRACLYDTEAHAKALGSEGLITTSQANTWPLEWTLMNGSYSNSSASAEPAGTPQFQGLHLNTTYYLVLSMSIGGSDTILMDESTSRQAVYSLRTLSGVEITMGSQSLQYYNTSYFDKGLEMRYNLSSSINLSIQYDIYSDAECTSQLASHEALVTGGYATTVTPQLTDNQLNIKLPPGAVSGLTPGSTYYLRITAWLNGSESTTPAGSAVFPFTIPAVSGVDALIYAVDAGSNYITYQVTVNDPQYAVMGADLSGDGYVRTGLYAVRFTDQNNNWIETIYDDYLFSTNVPRQMFKLTDGTIRGVTGTESEGVGGSTGTEYYRLYIFAVQDTDFDGIVDSGFTTFAGKKWEDLFSGLSATGTTIDKCKDNSTALTPTVTGYKFDANATGTFLTQLNGCWDTTSAQIYGIAGFNGHPLKDGGSVPQYLELKEQQLPDDNGLLINISRAAISRAGNTLSLLLQESFGIIVNDEQTFQSAYWQIRGTTSGGQSFSQSGTYTPDPGVGLFDTTTVEGFDKEVYRLTLPPSVPLGNYQVTVRLYKETGGTGTATSTISLTVVN